VEGGRLDFLCRDLDTDALVVVELKRGLPSDRVVGQTARYMGWVRSELADRDQGVEGIIVAHESDDRLRYAVAAVPAMTLFVYEVSFGLKPTAL
jgi:RecB family endonuclease NucS